MNSKALHVMEPDELATSREEGPAPRPFDPTLLLEEGLAAAALAMEDYRAVVRHCSHIVQVCPNHFEAWFNLGVARQQTGEIEEAIFSYHQAARLSPGDARPWINLGIARHAVDDTEGAREAYRSALDLDPAQPQALWNLAVILENSGARAEAMALYARTAAARPDWPEAWFRLGALRMEGGDRAGALAAFRECLELKPDFQQAALNAAICMKDTGDPEGARALLEEVLEQDPDSTDALRAAAAVCVECGDWKFGLAVRRKLAERRQSLPELTFNLALAADEQGHDDDAVRLYCEALRENPRFASALLNLGHVLARQGKAPEANECWRRAIALDGSLARGYFGSGQGDPS